MKNNLKYIVIAVSCLFGTSACIDDESTGAHIPLSEITIATAQDSFYVDYGSEAVITPTISQTIEGKELSYEWRASLITKTSNGQEKADSLKYISIEPELKYSFPQLGEYKVRLRVTNGDVNEMLYYRVFVQTPFIEGLFVLSTDEQQNGMTSFLRAKDEKNIPTGTGYDFKLRAFESINPGCALNDMTDVVRIGSDMMMSSRKDQLLYVFDSKTFDLLSVIDLKKDVPWMQPVAIPSYFFDGTDVSPVTEFFLLSAHGDFCSGDIVDMYASEDRSLYPEKAAYEKCFVSYIPNPDWNTLGHYFFVDNTNSRIDHFSADFGTNEASGSEDYFAGYNICNLILKDNIGLWVVASKKEDPSSVRITKFKDLDNYGWETNPFEAVEKKYDYQTDHLTLTLATQMEMSSVYNLCMYTNGSGIYQWKYDDGGTINKLPEEPVLTVDGEITCYSMSTDQRYLYLGVWNTKSQKELKGSVEVFDIESGKIVKTYPGIANKPVKVFYKK